MPIKQILLVHEDVSLQPLLERHLDSQVTLISLQSTAQTRRKIGHQAFPFIIIEATKDWYKGLKRIHLLNGSAENATFLVAPSSLFHRHPDCIKALSAAALEKWTHPPAKILTPVAKTLKDPVLDDFVERKLRDFVKRMRTSGVRNLYSMLLAEVERPLITHLLKETDGNQIRAAQLLGVNRNTLRKKIKALKITFKRPTKPQSRT